MARISIWLLLLLFILRLEVAAQSSRPMALLGDSLELTEVLDVLNNSSSCRCSFNGDRNSWSYIKIPRVQADLHRYVLDSLVDTLDHLLLNTGYTYDVFAVGGVREINLYPSVEKAFLVQGRLIDVVTGLGAESVRISARRSGVATRSDSAGYFQILAKERDLITFGGFRFEKDRRVVSRAQDEDNFMWVPLNTKMSIGASVTITDATQHFTKVQLGPVSHFLLNMEKVSRMPGVGDADVMQQSTALPGVSTHGPSGGVSMRGGNIDQNLYRLDGITLRQPQHQLGTMSIFNPQSVRRHEIFYAGFTPTYGRRASGVILTEGRSGLEQTRDGKAHGGFGFNLLNMQGYAEAPLISRGKKMNLAAHVSGRSSLSTITPAASSSLLYKNLLENRLQATDAALRQAANSGGSGVQLRPMSQFYDVNAKVELDIRETDRIAVTLFKAHDRLDYQERPQGQSAYYSDTLTTANSGISLSWNRDWFTRRSQSQPWLRPESRTYLSLSQFSNDYQYQLNQTATHTGLDQAHELEELTFNHVTKWQFNNRHELEGGIEYTHLEQSSSLKEEIADLLIDSVNTGQEALLLSHFANHTFSYPQNADTSGNFVRVTTGVRHTYYSPNRKNYWEPRVMADFVINYRLHLRASWGRYLQFSTLARADNRLNAGENMFVLAQGDSIDIVTAQHGNLGVFYRYRNWEFSLDAYYKQLRGLSMYSFGSTEVFSQQEPDMLLTGGLGFVKGVEAMGKFEYENFSGQVSYTLSRTQNQYDELNNGEVFHAAQDQLHRVSLLGLYEVADRWFFSMRWDYASGSPYTQASDFRVSEFPIGGDATPISYVEYGAVNQERLPDYHRLDMAIQYEFPLDAISTTQSNPVGGTIGLNFINVYNRQNIGQRRYRVLPASESESGQAELLSVDYRLIGFAPNIFIRLAF